VQERVSCRAYLTFANKKLNIDFYYYWSKITRLCISVIIFQATDIWLLAIYMFTLNDINIAVKSKVNIILTVFTFT